MPSHPQDITVLRLQMRAAGYQPVPVLRHDTLKPSAGKRPTMVGWQDVCATADEIEIQRWATDHLQRECSNTGILCGKVVGLDIDVPDPDLALQVQALADVMLPRTPLVRIGLAPKSLRAFRAEGIHHKISTPTLYLPNGTKVQVEALGVGNQFVSFGIHPDTKLPYTWPGQSPLDVPVADLPVLPNTALRRFMVAGEAVMRAAGGRTEAEIKAADAAPPATATAAPAPRKQHGAFPPTRQEVQEALTAVPNVHDWHGWHKIGAAIFDALADDGEDLFAAWSAQSPRNDSAKTQAKWRSYRTSKATTSAATLFYEAQRNGWRATSRIDYRSAADDAGDWTNSVPDATTDDHPGDADGFWPEPLDFLADAELTGAPELKPEHIPAAIAPFVFDTAARMGVDPAAVALCAIVALASVVSDDWRIQPKQLDDTWTENPRLWGAIVGDPSMLKTPILKAATAPIDRMEAESRKRHDNAMRRYEAELKAWKKDPGSDPASEPKHPRLDRYLVEGTTIEALTEALRDDYKATQNAPAGKLLIRQDEMSEWVASFDRYSGGSGGSDRGAYLRLFNGGRFTIDRVQRGTFAVPNWSACILGGIQPGPIRAIAKRSADDGLLQRFCYCVPARQVRGEDRAPDANGLQRYAALFPAMAALYPARGLGGAARNVVLHKDAHGHRQAMEDLTDAMAAMPDTSERLKTAFGKWPGLWARMTLVFHLIELADARARGNDTGGDVANVARGGATTATSYLRDILMPHLLRADAVMFATEQTGHARWIAGYILSKGENRIAARDIMRAYGALRAPEQRRELQEVMASLETLGWVRPEPQKDGRPPVAWEINPKVHAGFADRAKKERETRDLAKIRIREAIAKHVKAKAAG